MPYITSIERLAREEGRKEGHEEGRKEGHEEGRKEGHEEGRKEVFAEALALALELKFGDKGLAFAKELKQIKDLTKLRAIQDAIRTVHEIDELRKAL